MTKTKTEDVVERMDEALDQMGTAIRDLQAAVEDLRRPLVEPTASEEIPRATDS